MPTFSTILSQTNEMLRLSDEFTAKYLDCVVAKQDKPSIVIPATEPSQGEQKTPMVKPNGVTR